MAEAKVTRKELFARVKEVMSDDPEVVEMCDKYIASLSKPRKKTENPEMAEWRSGVATWLSEQDSPVSQAVAGEALGVSPQKAGAALRWLVGEGIAVVVEGEKKSDPKMYAIA